MSNTCNMKKVLSIETVNDYHARFGHQTLHPLVGVVDFSKIQYEREEGLEALQFGVYAIYLKQGTCSMLHYGRRNYDYQEGTLVFIAPGQVVSLKDDPEDYKPSGYGLFFHPDLLLGTQLGQKMSDYSFFSYEVNEALHISERERQTVIDCFQKIELELEQSIDKHSKQVITSIIELFLNYCVRFYDRQFITRDASNRGAIEQFERLLNTYFASDQPQNLGLPTVAYCAEQLNLSANYFGDLIKKETGKSAQEYIQAKTIEVAKERIYDPTKTVSEIAYELGFKYPQHFSRFFKQKVGYSPKAYRMLN